LRRARLGSDGDDPAFAALRRSELIGRPLQTSPDSARRRQRVQQRRYIAAAVAVGGSTVYRTKRRFVEGNLEAALNEEPRSGADRKLTSNEEALLIATACSSPPEGPRTRT
jgi:hypothetical protein